MRISELIKALEAAQQLLGDRKVYVRDDFGQYELATEVIEIGTIQEENQTVIGIIA